MSEQRWLSASERWFRLLLRLYPADFREEMGDAMVETYRERCRMALQRRGVGALLVVWWRALFDSLRNGPAERVRPAAGWRRGGNWGRDTELVVRRLLRAPLFVSIMVGTLTVGLGAFAVVYTVVYKVVLAPMPYEEPDDLYFVWRNYTWIQFGRGWLGGTDVAELQKVDGVIEDAAALLRQRVIMTVGQGAEPTEISVMATTPNLFELLGVRPALGRVFAPNEVGPDRPPLIVLTDSLWRKLGGDRAILGSELRLNGQPYTVIGVMPRSFAFVRNASLGAPEPADAYTTLTVNLAETNPEAGSYAGLIRAKRGASPAAVASAVDAVGRIIDERDMNSRGLKLYPVELKGDLVAGVRPALVVIGVAGVFLLLVLMVNVATLLLARAAAREHEYAVSRALGANRLALVRATLLEAGLLGFVGGVAGSFAAVWGTQLLVALAPLDLPRRESIVVDWGVGGVMVVVGVLLGMIAAIVPATWAARASLSSLLASSAVRGGGGHGRMRRGMVVVQVALALVLLTTGALVVRSFERLLRADPGFNPDGVLTMRIPMPTQVYPDIEQARALHDQITAALAALPGVQRVSAADAVPLTADANQTSIEVVGAPGNTGEPDHDQPLIDYIGIRAGYADVMGMRLIAGRPMADTRTPGVMEALIDRVVANHFFPTGNPIGARIPFGPPDTLTVVGVVEPARMYDVHRDGLGQVYVRAEDGGYRTLTFVLRTDRPPETLIPEARAAVHRIDPRLALADVRTMNEIVENSLRDSRVSAVLIAGFSVGALLLAAMGLYGVVSAAVTRRRHEMAVRLALGADYGRVLRLVLGEGARLILLGVVIGVPGTFFAGRAIQSALVDVSPTDPLTLISVALGLAVIAMAACYLPARRVLRIEPSRSLRQD